MRHFACLALLVACPIWLTACGGAATPQTPTSAVQQRVVAPATSEPEPEKAPVRHASVVRGLRGTLNQDDIHQAMDARRQALTDCIDVSQRRMRFLDGQIKFAFKVDAEGKPFEVRAIESDLGHQVLQDCFAEVLRTTAFPAPAGRTATRDFKWAMAVEPAGRATDVMEAEAVKPLLKEHTRDLYRECKLSRRRNRYGVTVYVGRRGKVIASGAVVRRGGRRARAQLPCFLEQVEQWRLPKVKRRSKVTFTLR